MLFLHTLLFFVLGISVVAIPISQLTTNISSRDVVAISPRSVKTVDNTRQRRRTKKSTSSTQPVKKSGASSTNSASASTVDLSVSLTGLWAHDIYPDRGGYPRRLYMIIKFGGILEVWPKPTPEEAKLLFKMHSDENLHKDWISITPKRPIPLKVSTGFPDEDVLRGIKNRPQGVLHTGHGWNVHDPQRNRQVMLKVLFEDKVVEIPVKTSDPLQSLGFTTESENPVA